MFSRQAIPSEKRRTRKTRSGLEWRTLSHGLYEAQAAGVRYRVRATLEPGKGWTWMATYRRMEGSLAGAVCRAWFSSEAAAKRWCQTAAVRDGAFAEPRDEWEGV